MRIIVAVFLLLITGLQYRIWVGEGSLAESKALEERVSKTRIENEIRKSRNSILRAEIIELRSGYESIEDQARSELGLIKEGETFFLLVNQRN